MSDTDSRNSCVPAMTHEPLLGLHCRRAESQNIPWDNRGAVIRGIKMFSALLKVMHQEDSKVTQPEPLYSSWEPRRSWVIFQRSPSFHPQTTNRCKDLRTSCIEVDGGAQESVQGEHKTKYKRSRLTGGNAASKGGKSKPPRVSWEPKQERVMRWTCGRSVLPNVPMKPCKLRMERRLVDGAV